MYDSQYLRVTLKSLTHININDEQSFYVHGKIVKYNKNTFGILHNRTKLRFAMVWIIQSKWFDRLVILLILVNSIVLGMKDYIDDQDKTPMNRMINQIEPLFTYSFLLECICKILAQGFIMG